MDRETKEIYERHAREWIGARRPAAVEDGRLDAFASRLPANARVADLGSGPGWYAAALRERGLRAVALDLSLEMLQAAGRAHPGLPRLCGDLARLPFARGALEGVFAINTYCHVACAEMPTALAHLHASLATDAPIELTLSHIEDFAPDAGERARGEAHRRGEGEWAGRLFSTYTPERALSLLTSAGFHEVELEVVGPWIRVRARRALTLPDFVRSGLRVLVCGLNPSVYSAEQGIPFVRSGNRFWPAATAAGLVEVERDPFQALERGVGFTDLVKRATPRASELRPDEYQDGIARLKSMVERYLPDVVCFVGLEGWRQAVDPKAEAGWIDPGFAGRAAYLMPSTSGLNAHTDLAGFTAHLASATSR
jgi:TDG/mug DNA glycosylase family protein